MWPLINGTVQQDPISLTCIRKEEKLQTRGSLQDVSGEISLCTKYYTHFAKNPGLLATYFIADSIMSLKVAVPAYLGSIYS